MMNRVADATRGFTLVELIVSMAIITVVAGSAFALMTPAQNMFAAQPEMSEMQQRLRVGVDALTRDLLMAGAGIYSGAALGPLGVYFVPVLPSRIGAVNADADGDVFDDRLTVVYVPSTAAQTRIGEPLGSTVASVSVTSDPGCPLADPACGFEKGMAVLVMDDSGAWDTFTVSDVLGPVLQLQHRGAHLRKTYDAGASISQVVTHTYWLKTDASTETFNLMRYDGNQSDVPVADNVVGLRFEYFADGLVPLFPADLRGVKTIRATLRVQAPARFRGATGPLFVRGGTSRTSEGYLPDQEVTFDVTPRNLRQP